MLYSQELCFKPLLDDLFPLTHQVLQQGLDENVAPGFVVGYWQKKSPNVFKAACFGNRRVEPSKTPMHIETVFDLASLSKIFSTTALVALLVERGWLKWSTPVEAFFPSFKNSKIQVWHLLSHTAGLVAWMPFWKNLKNQFHPRPLFSIPIEQRQRAMREWVFETPLEGPPGVKAVYSDLSFLILGFLLEEVTQMPLDYAVRFFVWKSMGISSAFYRRIFCAPSVGVLENVAATENSEWRGGVLQGQVFDDNCWAMGGYGGHAGVFGTVRDLLHFSRSLFLGFLSQSTLERIWKKVPYPENCSRTLGWDTPSGSSPSVGQFFSDSSVGHLGYTGTSLWIDPEVGLAVALLSNRVHPSRENNKMGSFRSRFHNAFRQDFEKKI